MSSLATSPVDLARPEDVLAALEALAQRNCFLQGAAEAPGGCYWICRHGDAGVARLYSVTGVIARAAFDLGWLAPADGGFALSRAGISALRQARCERSADRAEAVRAPAPTADGRAAQTRKTPAPIRNDAESPLTWLRSRTDRDGRPMLSDEQFAAGERLRADYERAQLMPRVTANWSQAGTGRQGAGGGNSAAELTEVALAARRRVEGAIAALDPELAGLAVDFCCFLKGLEQIETERRWPARSAKLVLRLALAALARHYGLATRAKGPRASGIRHWGSEGYRPTIE